MCTTENANFHQFIYECSPSNSVRAVRGGVLRKLGGALCLDHLYKVHLSNFAVDIMLYYIILYPESKITMYHNLTSFFYFDTS